VKKWGLLKERERATEIALERSEEEGLLRVGRG
jgi:hypothetical protein